MSLTLKDIAKKLLKGELPAAASDDLARARLNICEACPQLTMVSRQCRLCHCFMDVKTKLLEADCPMGKW
jgi:hypothetical protein